MAKNKSKSSSWKEISIISIFFFFIVLILICFNLVKFYPERFGKFIPFIKIDKPELAQTFNSDCLNCERRLIDGVLVKKGMESTPLIALVIDNQTDARPAHGLSKANLVYEAEAEGRITRYLAFFVLDEEIDAIGPVRSARPYFIDWAQEFSAIIAHCGGSPEALVKISREDISNLNEYYNSAYFWRNKDIAAPHNIFTSSQLLNDYLEKNSFDNSKFFSWKYRDESDNITEITNSQIKISYKEPDYAVKWVYDAENNEYLRYLANEIHKDAQGNEIRAKNVIIHYADTEVLDDELRLRITTVGSNKALICLDGQCREGEWRKKSAAARARYYYDNNEEVEFNAGTTWIQVVRSDQEIDY